MKKKRDVIERIRLEVLKKNPGVSRTEELLFLNIQALAKIVEELQAIRQELERKF